MDDQYQQNLSEPSEEDKAWLSQVEQGYIGLEKPKVEHREEPVDKHAWKRINAANKLHLDDRDLATEPDDGAASPSEAYA